MEQIGSALTSGTAQRELFLAFCKSVTRKQGQCCRLEKRGYVKEEEARAIGPRDLRPSTVFDTELPRVGRHGSRERRRSTELASK
ncbi:hypothetical protein K0M31_010551, partial [Melipona bicolor]